jgi:hypothetical protein
MLVKFNLPESTEYPCGKQVWVRVEDIDRVEGHADWKYKETKVYLKRNPSEPFLVIKKGRTARLEPNQALHLTRPRALICTAHWDVAGQVSSLFGGGGRGGCRRPSSSL